ncbi:MAG: peptidase [Sphingomonas bacterium]|uniref:M20/M25/M40 family metallo-hydrolase n=1 Tax=Sphingomonas bacterium TaxID=1895847 RepID=UPI00263550D0|nr:M20/M25/M40 family metallo-hydrolase [Sphingomonas bacterium]MDB5710091.1 peptidase [Sphingomonas bacterium]
MNRYWGLLAAIAGAIILAIIATTPPAPAPATAAAADFSATRAMVDDRIIARAPHPTGSPADAEVRSYLVARLRAMGLETSTSGGTMSSKAVERLDLWRGHPASPPPLTNVVGILPGKDRSLPAVLLMAHHDSVWGSPGAADDGAGVASALETIRAIKTAGQPPRDLMVLFSDGEELGLEGAKAFFANDPRRTHVGVIVNMETRGGGGRASMFETGSDNGAMTTLFGQAVHRPVSTSLSVFIYKKLPNSTDYTVAKELGYPGFNFAFIGRPSQYHSPSATPDALDQGAVQDMGRQVLDLTRALLAAPALPGKAPDRVFFDVFGLFFVSYAAWVGWMLLAVGAIGYGAATFDRGRLGDIGRGVAMTLALFVGAGLLLFAVNFVSGGYGRVNYYDRLAAIPRLEVQALLLCLAAAALVWGLIAAARSASAGLTAGMAVPLLLLGLFAQATAPTAAFPIIVPLFLGGVAMAIWRFFGDRVGVVASVIAAMLGVGYMIALSWQLIQAVGPVTPMVVALPLALAAVLAAPLVPAIARGRALKAAGLLVVLALAIALWVRLDALAPSVAVYSSDH